MGRHGTVLRLAYLRGVADTGTTLMATPRDLLAVTAAVTRLCLAPEVAPLLKDSVPLLLVLAEVEALAPAGGEP